MTDPVALLEELNVRLNAIERDVACNRLSAAQTFTKVRDAHADAIALMRGQSWQPIETAPKDGRRVLAFAGARQFIARHGRTVGWWDDNDLMRDPTHWQPLPDAPASQDQDGGKA